MRSRALRLTVLLPLALLALLAPLARRAAAVQAPPADPASRSAPRSAPRGSVLAVGGGVQGRDVFDTLVARAGGRGATIVYIPTAGAEPDRDTASIRDDLARAGASRVLVLHTRDRSVADSDSLAALIQAASGVFIGGGRQGLLVDAYLGTAVERALHELLARGGIIAGSSAGASILASFLVRGSPRNEDALIAKGYERGFGFVPSTAIDPHVIARRRHRDLPDRILRRHPALLAIGIDDGTAVLFDGDTATAFGRGIALVSHALPRRGGTGGKGGARPLEFRTTLLRPGDRYHLRARRPIAPRTATRYIRASADTVFTRLQGHGGGAVLVAAHDIVHVARSDSVSGTPPAFPATAWPGFPMRGVARTFSHLLGELLLRAAVIAPTDSVPLGLVDSTVSSAPFARLITDAGSMQVHQGAFIEQVMLASQRSYGDLLSSLILRPMGLAFSRALGATGDIRTNVDELHRFDRALHELDDFVAELTTPWGKLSRQVVIEPARWFPADSMLGVRYQVMSGDPSGKGGTLIRVPACRLVIAVLARHEQTPTLAYATRLLRSVLSAPETPPSPSCRSGEGSAADAPDRRRPSGPRTPTTH